MSKTYLRPGGSVMGSKPKSIARYSLSLNDSLKEVDWSKRKPDDATIQKALQDAKNFALEIQSLESEVKRLKTELEFQVSRNNQLSRSNQDLRTMILDIRMGRAKW